MVNTLTLPLKDYPLFLRGIADPPANLYYQGPLPELLTKPRLAVVGSRKVSAYGREVTFKLAGEAAAKGAVIISGLAFGIDSIAHQAALDVGGKTIAVLPTPIEKIYPASHRQLAKDILSSGGAIVSEYPPNTVVYKMNFIARNRIISGLSQATLIPEAALKSGSLHTARFTLEQGREVLAVPGNITSETSVGTNNLLKSGAVPITSASDLLFALGIDEKIKKKAPKGQDSHEQLVLNLLAEDVRDGAKILEKSHLEAQQFNQALTMLELTGKIRRLGANQWTLS